MGLPELTFKEWEGDPNEYFRWIDMNRLTYNANIIAREAGVSQVQFVEADRTQQFRFDEVQKLENLTKSIALILGVPISIESQWYAGRSLTYHDFERIESNLYACYRAMGGVGERLPTEKFRIIVTATLFKGDWAAQSPSYQDIDVPFYHDGADAMVWIDYHANDEQRYWAIVARLKTEVLADRKIRVWALGATPRADIPMRIKRGVLDMNETINLTASGWSGNGPWTQNVSISSPASDAILGVWEGMTDEAVNQFVEGMIFPSAINGSTVTIRCIGTKPTIDLNPKLMWNEQETI